MILAEDSNPAPPKEEKKQEEAQDDDLSTCESGDTDPYEAAAEANSEPHDRSVSLLPRPKAGEPPRQWTQAYRVPDSHYQQIIGAVIEAEQSPYTWINWLYMVFPFVAAAICPCQWMVTSPTTIATAHFRLQRLYATLGNHGTIPIDARSTWSDIAILIQAQTQQFYSFYQFLVDASAKVAPILHEHEELREKQFHIDHGAQSGFLWDCDLFEQNLLPHLAELGEEPARHFPMRRREREE